LSVNLERVARILQSSLAGKEIRRMRFQMGDNAGSTFIDFAKQVAPKEVELFLTKPLKIEYLSELAGIVDWMALRFSDETQLPNGFALYISDWFGRRCSYLHINGVISKADAGLIVQELPKLEKQVNFTSGVDRRFHTQIAMQGLFNIELTNVLKIWHSRTKKYH
ncbi:hypothetical protein PFISCL1PPCAC_1103, partial [Pristionchus fissidentatus]